MTGLDGKVALVTGGGRGIGGVTSSTVPARAAASSPERLSPSTAATPFEPMVSNDSFTHSTPEETVRESIIVVVEFHIEPEQAERWLGLALEHLTNCVAEEGMLRFWVQRNDRDPAHFLFYEEWADRGDLDTSMTASWRAAYMRDTEALWETPRAMAIYRRVETPWERLDATGLPISLAGHCHKANTAGSRRALAPPQPASPEADET